MTLRKWIDTLAALPPGARVRFDDGTVPTRLMSWRGVYEELTLDSSGNDGDNPTVAGLLKDAVQAVGKTFQGYKGGDFVMGEHTPVWADPWGEYRSRGIAGVEVDGSDVVVKTIDLSDYR